MGVVNTLLVDKAFPPKESAYQPIRFVPEGVPVNVNAALLTQPAMVPPETGGGEGAEHCAVRVLREVQHSSTVQSKK